MPRKHRSNSEFQRMETQMNTTPHRFIMPLSKEAIEEAVEMQDAQQVMWEAESERDFQAKVIEVAQRLGWVAHAERPARTLTGWVTPIQGDKGFMDIWLAKVNKDGTTATLIAWELKSEKGRLTLEEKVWLAILEKVPGIIVGVKRPSDWDEILKALS